MSIRRRGPRLQFKYPLTFGSGTKHAADQYFHRHYTLVVSTVDGAFDEELRKTLAVAECSGHCAAVISGGVWTETFNQDGLSEGYKTMAGSLVWPVLTPGPQGGYSLAAGR